MIAKMHLRFIYRFLWKSIVPLHQEINNNRYEAKTTYTPFTNYRSYGCATGFNDCISSMQYAWHTNEFTAICYGYRIYHPKTPVSSLHYCGKIYYRSNPVITLCVSQWKDWYFIISCLASICKRLCRSSEETNGVISLWIPTWAPVIPAAKRRRGKQKTKCHPKIHTGNF